MRQIDRDGLILCEIQANVFEKSIEKENCSSSIFVRRFMNSTICEKMDSIYFLDESCSVEKILEEVNDEYGKSSYGKQQFSKEELYWMGYIYRYFAYVSKLNSKQIYKIINAKELRNLYYPYHTLDPQNAIERILEAKDYVILDNPEDITKKGVEILRRIKLNKL